MDGSLQVFGVAESKPSTSVFFLLLQILRDWNCCATCFQYWQYGELRVSNWKKIEKFTCVSRNAWEEWISKIYDLRYTINIMWGTDSMFDYHRFCRRYGLNKASVSNYFRVLQYIQQLKRSNIWHQLVLQAFFEHI